MVYIPAHSSKRLPMTICSDKNFANIAKRSHFWIFALQPLFSNYASDPLEVELISWLELVRNPRPFPSVFTYCKQSNTGSGEGPRTRISLTYQPHTYIIYYSQGVHSPQVSERLTGSTSRLITAISAVLTSITAVRGSDTLSIVASKRSTSTGNCTNRVEFKSYVIATQTSCRCYRSQHATVKIDWKLTAVPLITAIRAVSNPITVVKSSADTLAIGTLKLAEKALTCTLVIISIETNYLHRCYKAMLYIWGWLISSKLAT